MTGWSRCLQLGACSMQYVWGMQLCNGIMQSACYTCCYNFRYVFIILTRNLHSEVVLVLLVAAFHYEWCLAACFTCKQ